MMARSPADAEQLGDAHVEDKGQAARPYCPGDLPAAFGREQQASREKATLTVARRDVRL
jgi:hypothetical protein